MTPHTFSTKSKFYKTLKFLSGKSDGWYRLEDWDTCSLIRHVIASVFSKLCILVILSVVVGLMTTACFAFGAMITEHLFELPNMKWYHYPALTLLGAAAIVIVVAIALSFMCLYTVIGEWFQKRKPEPKGTQSPAGVLYRSWKDKVCSKVEFK